MRMRFSFPVTFIDVASEQESFDVAFANSIRLTEHHLDVYLDAEIADEGVVGGDVYLRCDRGQPTLDVYFWHPSSPSKHLIDSLQAYTVAQIEDGIGENGFEFEHEGTQLLVVAKTEEPEIAEIYNDGRVVLKPPGIAIAARDGDSERLEEEIKADPNSIDRPHQGSTALHLAILYGHSDVVRLLLNSGANSNSIDAQGITPLEVCALSNSLDDERSRAVGQMLLDSGGDPQHLTPDGESARDYAELRGKKRLAEILSPRS